jgi:hypothetical protein
VDVGSDVLRALHDHARQHRRERRAALHPALSAREHLLARVDRQRVHAHFRGHARHGRATRRSVRTPAHVPVRRDRLRGLELPDRPGPERHVADRLSRHAGRRLGVHDAGDPFDHHQHVRGSRARPRDRHVGGGLGDGARHRPRRRGAPGPGSELAVDLLPQRPRRDPRHRRNPARRAGVARRDRRPRGRRAWRRRAHDRARRARAGPDPEQRMGLGLRARARAVRARARRALRLRRDRAQPQGADGRLRCLSLALVLRRQPSRVHRLVRDVRDVLLPRPPP